MQEVDDVELKMIGRWHWCIVAIVTGLLGIPACSGGSPSTPSTAPASARLNVTATTVNRLDSGGQVTGRQINLVWTNLPSTTAKVSIDRSSETGQQAKDLGTALRTLASDKRVTLEGAVNTYADTEVNADVRYNYTITALDGRGISVGIGEAQGAKVGPPSDVGALTLTAPSPDSNLIPTDPVHLTWTAPSPAPHHFYIQVANAFTGRVVTSLIVNGDVTSASIRTQRSSAPQTESIFASSDSIPNLKDVLAIHTQGVLEDALTFRATVASVVGDRTPLTSATAVTIREGAAVSFTVVAYATYFMGS